MTRSLRSRHSACTGWAELRTPRRFGSALQRRKPLLRSHPRRLAPPSSQRSVPRRPAAPEPPRVTSIAPAARASATSRRRPPAFGADDSSSVAASERRATVAKRSAAVGSSASRDDRAPSTSSADARAARAPDLDAAERRSVRRSNGAVTAGTTARPHCLADATAIRCHRATRAPLRDGGRTDFGALGDQRHESRRRPA